MYYCCLEKEKSVLPADNCQCIAADYYVRGNQPDYPRSVKTDGPHEEFCAGNGDWTGRCKDVQNEVEEISYLITELKERFLTTIRKTKEESAQIHGRMKANSGKVSEIGGSITGIGATMQETNANVMTQTESIRQIDENCGDVAAAVEELAEEAKRMASRADEVVTRVGEIVPQLIQSKKNATDMAGVSRARLEEAIQGTK